MPKMRPSLESAEGKLEEHMQSQSPCYETVRQVIVNEGRQPLPKCNVAVHRKRHRIHEFSGVWDQRE